MVNELIETAARALVRSNHAIALTGAGISTESGIPDFRGPSGVWTMDPGAERRAYRSYERFLSDPKSWWQERLRAPSLLGDLENALPNAGHFALVDLEQIGILKTVITQNVDGLHVKAGAQRVIEYHGSLFKLRCAGCGWRFARDDFDLEAMDREDRLPPYCPRCRGIVKADTVAFGEPIPADVARESVSEASRCDVMLICGTSAVVHPFANLPRMARERRAEWPGTSIQTDATHPSPVTIIEINGEPTQLTDLGISDFLIEGRTGVVLPGIVEAVRRLTE